MPCVTPIALFYPPQLVTVPCVTPIALFYPPQLVTVPCVTPIALFYPPQLVTVPCLTPIALFYPHQLVTVPCVTPTAVFPAPYVKQCQEGDPKIVECITAALHHLRPYLAKGKSTRYGNGGGRDRPNILESLRKATKHLTKSQLPRLGCG